MSFLANLWQKIAGRKSAGESQATAQPGLTTDAGQALWISVECDNCGEHIKVMLRKPAKSSRDGVEREEALVSSTYAKPLSAPSVTNLSKPKSNLIAVIG